MMNKKSSEEVKTGTFHEVWGDLVALKDLFFACVIGVVVTLGAYLGAKSIFLSDPNLEAGLATGYALFAGLGGCVLSCVICCILFRPKRVILEDSSEIDILKVLEAENVNLVEELKELRMAPEEVLQEMRDNGLGMLVDMCNNGSLEKEV